MNVDVVIVGGGVVGATLALALGRGGLRMAIVEASPPRAITRTAAAYDLRVSALTPASAQVLRALGVWERLPVARLTPFHRMEVWESDGGAIDFDAADIGAAALGYIVENQLIQDGLESALASLDNVTWHRPATVEAFRAGAEEVVVTAGGSTLRAKLLVGADGLRSTVRELAGIAHQEASYDQCAVVTNVATQHSHGNVARQRFLPTGPLAFLPLPEQQCSIVWTTTSSLAETWVEAPEPEFQEILATALAGRLGDVRLTGPRASFPLSHSHAERYVASRLALLGDAAHGVHPLAGQGLNLGIMDAASLTDVVLKHHAKQRDIGNFGNLRAYERWRRGQNRLAELTLSTLNKLYLNPLVPTKWARTVGVMATQQSGPLKRLLMELAAGTRGDLATLARAPSWSRN